MLPWVVALTTPESLLVVDYAHTVTSCGREAQADVWEIERRSPRQENLVDLGQICVCAVTLGLVKLPVYESTPYV